MATFILEMSSHVKFIWDQVSSSCCLAYEIQQLNDGLVLYSKVDTHIRTHSRRETGGRNWTQWMGPDHRKVFKSTAQNSVFQDSFVLSWLDRSQEENTGNYSCPWALLLSESAAAALLCFPWQSITAYFWSRFYLHGERNKSWGSHKEALCVWMLWITGRTKQFLAWWKNGCP